MPLSPPRLLRVLVVSDDALARAGLRSALVDRADVEVVGDTASDRSLEAAVDRHAPDVLLWDLGGDSSAAHEFLNDLELPVVVLLDDPAWGAAVIQSGALGVLPRQGDGERLAAALWAASKGLLVIEPGFAGALLPATLDGAGASPLQALTPREREVLPLLAEGLSNRAIAGRLGVSEHTTKFHVNAILTKLGARTRTEAVVRAARLGLVHL
jgi:DNA-binding NarL/FixJ family response regulator